jgi:hypothetical protein
VLRYSTTEGGVFGPNGAINAVRRRSEDFLLCPTLRMLEGSSSV